jgi:hypothetical protein
LSGSLHHAGRVEDLSAGGRAVRLAAGGWSGKLAAGRLSSRLTAGRRRSRLTAGRRSGTARGGRLTAGSQPAEVSELSLRLRELQEPSELFSLAFELRPLQRCERVVIRRSFTMGNPPAVFIDVTFASLAQESRAAGACGLTHLCCIAAAEN